MKPDTEKVRKRQNDVRLMFDDAEMAIINGYMEKLGIKNRSKLLRKMILEARIIQVDTKDISEASRLLRISANNINQVAKRANETGSCYEADVIALRNEVKKMNTQVRAVIALATRLKK